MASDSQKLHLSPGIDVFETADFLLGDFRPATMNVTTTPIFENFTTLAPQNGTANSRPTTADDQMFYMVLKTSCWLVLFFYVYYIPRLIAFRCASLTEDKEANPSLTEVKTLDDAMATLIGYCLAAALNRLIAPLVLLICLQQYALVCPFDMSQVLLEGPFQHVYCVVSAVLVFGGSFLRLIDFFEATEVTVELTADPLWPHPFEDVILPLIVFVFYNFARVKMKKESTYSIHDTSLPTTMDQMGKIVWFQGVMALMSVVAMGVRSDDVLKEGDRSTWDFFAAAQTPVLSWVAFRSILRKQRPTRPCFLLCCAEEEKTLPAGTSTTN
ncbi:unnamed protein product [Caenorhabditis auriculariae]|uniref:Transmembrane protein n=1 Tax=Caenorhabditis auriculariae TaxID=2777116 RepID=A0A8S1HGU8_9PELO|nr:unnamed protein product [Caenorhabditis auriculariae]